MTGGGKDVIPRAEGRKWDRAPEKRREKKRVNEKEGGKKEGRKKHPNHQ